MCCPLSITNTLLAHGLVLRYASIQRASDLLQPDGHQRSRKPICCHHRRVLHGKSSAADVTAAREYRMASIQEITMKHPITGLDHSPVICPHHHVSSSASNDQCMQCDKQRMNTTSRSSIEASVRCISRKSSSVHPWSTFEDEHHGAREQLLPSRCHHHS